MANVPGIAGYAEEAPDLLERYERREFADIHSKTLRLFPAPPADALDIGAGTGRDAAGLAQRGYDVVAVEPVAEMREGAQNLHPEANIAWIDDGLPDLRIVAGLGRQFDLVLMNAVLMHLDAETRAKALASIAPLIRPNGILAMSLRHGPVPAGRTMFDVGGEEIRTCCQPLGFSVLREIEASSHEQNGVSWTRMVLRRDKAAD